VIGELQRYMEPALRLADPAAGTIRVSGVFSTAEPRLTLAALEKSLDLAVTGPEQGPLLIARRAD
jgi:ferric-dicitrate binding protein FerR (iron transport regulator)